jgi:hypothetical protein
MFFEKEKGGGGVEEEEQVKINYVYGTEIKGNSPAMRHF